MLLLGGNKILAPIGSSPPHLHPWCRQSSLPGGENKSLVFYHSVKNVQIIQKCVPIWLKAKYLTKDVNKNKLLPKRLLRVVHMSKSKEERHLGIIKYYVRS